MTKALEYRRKFFKKDHWIDRLYYFFFDLYWGLYYKYPLCCILQFSCETFRGIFSAKHRWETFGFIVYNKPPSFEEKEKYIVVEKIQHVPCDKCMKKICEN